jgi:hypothetical protein
MTILISGGVYTSAASAADLKAIAPIPERKDNQTFSASKLPSRRRYAVLIKRTEQLKFSIHSSDDSD